MEMINIRALPMNRRAFDALPGERRTAILAQEDSKAFLEQMRSLKGQNRTVTGTELTIPIVFLELIAENMFRYSKLLNRVRVRNVTGEARQTIAGTIPEAVWTEMCGAINELSFGFNQITVDGYTPIEVTITGTDLETASSGDNVKIVKVFVKTEAGIWSVA